MDLNAISQLIGSVGFPIAACIVMFFQNDKLQKTLSDISITMQRMTDEISDVEDRLAKMEGDK